MNLFRTIKECDFLFFVLIILNSLHFWQINIGGENSLFINIIIIIYLYYKRVPRNHNFSLIIGIVSFILILNLIINHCGIGAILGYLDFILLLFLIPFFNLSKKNFDILFYFSVISLFGFSYKIINNPELLLPEEYGGEDINGNMVGLYLVYLCIFEILFIPSNSIINKIVIILSFIIAVNGLLLSECRAAEIGFLSFVILGLLFYFRKKSYSIKESKMIHFLVLCIFIGGLVFVFLSIGDYSSQLSSIIESFSNITDNIKGGSLSLRGDMWEEAIDAFWNSPIIGTGSKFRLKSYGGDALALHNSSLNFLVVYGIFIYLITVYLVNRLIKNLTKFLPENKRIFLCLAAYTSIVIMGYTESCLMDNFKLYSLMPLIYAYTIKN